MRLTLSVAKAHVHESSSSKYVSSSSNTSSTVGFWGFLGFGKLLSRATVALDCRPIVICAVDMFLGHILRFFCSEALPQIGHVLSLYKRQNILDQNLNFFLVIVKHVFRAFGMLFLRKYFLGYI